MVEYVIAKEFEVWKSVKLAIYGVGVIIITMIIGGNVNDIVLLGVIFLGFLAIMTILQYFLVGDIKTEINGEGITITEKGKLSKYQWSEFWTWYRLRRENELKGDWLLARKSWVQIGLRNEWDSVLLKSPLDEAVREKVEEYFRRMIGEESRGFPRLSVKDKEGRPILN